MSVWPIKPFFINYSEKKSMVEYVVSYNACLMIICLQNVVLAEQDRLVHIVLNSGPTHWLINTYNCLHGEKGGTQCRIIPLLSLWVGGSMQ